MHEMQATRVSSAGAAAASEAPEKAYEDGAAATRALRAQFGLALQTRPELVHESDYLFGGQAVRFHIAGRALARLVHQPFEHLAVDNRSDLPQLTIELWDEQETGIPYPSSMDGQSDGQPRMISSPDARFVGYRMPGSVTWFDRVEKYMVGWRVSGERLWTGERSKPLTYLLPIWYHDCGVLMIHAGLIALGGEGLLIGGPSGSGKTTATLACLLGGYDFLGDDHCGLQVTSDGRFVGHSFYSGARVAPKHLARFPRLADHAIVSNDPKDDKLLIPMSLSFPTQLRRSANIRAILLPRLGDLAESRLWPASKGEALLRLAPTSLIRQFGPGARGFERLTKLVTQVPSYWLKVGRDLAGIPSCIRDII